MPSHKRFTNTAFTLDPKRRIKTRHQDIVSHLHQHLIQLWSHFWSRCILAVTSPLLTSLWGKGDAQGSRLQCAIFSPRYMYTTSWKPIQHTLIPIHKYLFVWSKNINTFWSKGKINDTNYNCSMISFNTTPLQLWNGKALGETAPYKNMLCASHVLRDVAQLFQPLLSCNRNEETVYKHRCKLACHAHISTLFTGHKQRFIHTHMTGPPPIRTAKLSEVFMNVLLRWTLLVIVKDKLSQLVYLNICIK